MKKTKKYKNPVTHLHRMERLTRMKIDAMVTFQTTRIDIINRAINEYIQNYG